MGIGLKAVFATVAVAVISIICFYCYDNFNAESIRGKRVVITGASQGIGRKIAFQYAKLGAKLLITARREHVLAEVAKTCKELGAESVHIVKADMSLSEDRVRLRKAAEEHLKGTDHLIVNHVFASIGLWNGNEQNKTFLRNILEINFFAYVEVASEFLPMLKQSQGSLGIVSSLAGKIPFSGMAGYAACKHALHGFFGSVRQEFKMQNIDIAISLSVLGLIGTEGVVEYSKINEKFDMTYAADVDDTAMAIIKGVTGRYPEIYYPFLTRLMVDVHKFIPNIYENTFSSGYAEIMI